MNEDSRKRTGMLLRCCMCIGGAFGIVSNCIGIYFSPMAEALSVGVGRISVMVTLLSMSNALFAPVFVKLRQRFRLNHLMGAGVLLCMLSYLLLSFAGSVPLVYLCGILSGIGMCCFANVPVTLILQDWYGEKNGSALGIAMAFSGVFGAVMNPVLSRIISGYSYAVSLRLTALFMGITVLPCALSMRMKHAAVSSETTAAARQETAAVPSALMVMLFAVGIVFSLQCALNQHFSALAISEGYTLEASATVLTALMVGNIVFKLLYGFASDRTDPMVVSMVWSLLGSAGTLCVLLFSSNGALLRGGAAMYGAFFSLNTVALSLTTQQVAKHNYAEVYARLSLVCAAVYALAVSVYGMMYDTLGTYHTALMLIAALSPVSILLLSILRKRTKQY